MKSEKLPTVATEGDDLIHINNSKLPHWVKYSAVAVNNSSNGKSKISDGVAKISTAIVGSCDRNSVAATSTTTATALAGSEDDEEDEL